MKNCTQQTTSETQTPALPGVAQQILETRVLPPTAEKKVKHRAECLRSALDELSMLKRMGLELGDLG